MYFDEFVYRFVNMHITGIRENTYQAKQLLTQSLSCLIDLKEVQNGFADNCVQFPCQEYTLLRFMDEAPVHRGFFHIYRTISTARDLISKLKLKNLSCGCCQNLVFGKNDWQRVFKTLGYSFHSQTSYTFPLALCLSNACLNELLTQSSMKSWCSDVLQRFIGCHLELMIY